MPLWDAYEVSERRVCRATGFVRTTQRYRSRRDPQTGLRMRLEDPAVARLRYGYRRLPVLLRREGWGVNHKRIYRPYREERLSIRAKTLRRRRAGRYRASRAEIEGPNQIWARDFMSDALFDGQAFRILTIVECHSPESLAVVPRTCFRAYQVTEALDQPIRQRGAPKTLRCDNHPEFAGRALVQWAY